MLDKWVSYRFIKMKLKISTEYTEKKKELILFETNI